MATESAGFGHDADLERLPTAGLLRRAWSLFAPDRLTGWVEATAGADGDLVLRPRYEVAGRSVEPDEVRDAEEQRVRGRTVRTDATAAAVLAAVGGGRTVPADRAREVVRELARRFVPVKAAETGGPLATVRVRAAPALSVDAADRLTVAPRVVTKSGRPAPPPKPAALRRDGWYAAAGHLFRVALTGTEYDRLLFAAAPTVLSGDEVPRFLVALPELEPHLAGLTRTPELAALAVRDATPLRLLRVAEDDDAVRVTPELALPHGGRLLRSTDAALAAARTADGGFVRVPEGWLRLTAAHLAEFDDAAAVLPSTVRAPARGEAIPDRLEIVRNAAIAGWTADVAPAVFAEHQLLDGPAEVAAAFDVDDADGQPELRLRVTYRIGGETFSHADLAAAVDAGRRWVRVPGGWASVPEEAVAAASKAAVRNGLIEEEDGWRGPAIKRPSAVRAFEQIAAVTDAAVSKLHDGPFDLTTEVAVRDAGDRPELVVTQTVEVDGESVPLDRFGEAVAARREWLPVRNGWARVDEGLVAKAAAVERQECVRRVGGELVAPAERLSSVAEAYAGLGAVKKKRTAGVEAGPAQIDVSLNLVESDGQALLALSPHYRHGRFRLTAEQVEAAIRDGSGWVRLTAAWVRVDEAAVGRVSREAARLGLEPPDGRTAAGTFLAPPVRHAEVAGGFGELGAVRREAGFDAFLDTLRNVRDVEAAPLPASLAPDITLRPYQQIGHDWLCWLRRHGLAGILADDMGLGKTLQTLCAVRLDQERRAVQGRHEPALIVCPASLLLNWQTEIGRFFVDTDSLVYHGSNRHSLLDRLQNGLLGGPQFLITSYATAANDAALLSTVRWSALVLDEAHYIKNPSSKRSRQLRTIPAAQRICLSGTPLQNRLLELWSLFDFLMPGFLGTQAEFKRTYAGDRGANLSAALGPHANLERRIDPFVLRRLKADVAKDLPAKQVVHLPVALSPLQVRLYEGILEGAEFHDLLEAVENDEAFRVDRCMLAVLAKLRNVCNHPILAVDSEPGRFRVDDSGKLGALKELLEELKLGDGRALLFSQSTKMLDLIERCCEQWHAKTLRLDGKTPPAKRLELVDRFNADTSFDCFLISTKAGGTGLNLTGADTVIFYDHDWNPANDRQAEDRAHRIGQTRNVTVYKLVSAGTIEEEILRRQGEKQRIADLIVTADNPEAPVATRKQVLDLFGYRGGKIPPRA